MTCRSVSPGLRSRALSRGVSRGQGLGAPVQSGVSDASFDTAVEGALSCMDSAISSTQGELRQSALRVQALPEDLEGETLLKPSGF